MIKKFLLTVLLSSSLFSQTIFERWHETDKLIRDGRVLSNAGVDSIKIYVDGIDKLPKSSVAQYYDKSKWKFPMNGWTSVTYRNNGDDYKDARFDYFQGGEYKDHPAHDIFILDNDSNGIEDVTNKKVEAVAMCSGYIISFHDGWKKGDFLRSGNYVKLYDPKEKAIVYYSHLDTVFVIVGQFVKAGTPLGYIGRTGRKAINGRTHLHIAYYRIDDGYPEPEDIIEELWRLEKEKIKK